MKLRGALPAWKLCLGAALACAVLTTNSPREASFSAATAEPSGWADFGVQSARMKAVVQTGDFDAARKAAKDLGGTCAACHKTFRTESN